MYVCRTRLAGATMSRMTNLVHSDASGEGNVS